MKQVMINQCDFCEKTSFAVSTIKKHEKKCFFNPVTRSCAACLWFSRVHDIGNETMCYIGKFLKAPEGERQKLQTNCPSWKNYDLVADLDLFENNNQILNRLMAGDTEFFNNLEKENGL